MALHMESIKVHIDRLLSEKEQILVAIDGCCGAGKSTLAALLAREYDCNLFHMDDFFLRPEQRRAERLAQPGGNVDYERFREEVLQPLKAGIPFSYRPYDCGTGELAQPVAVMPKKISIIEGSYSQHPYFGQVYDLKFFLRIAPQLQRERIGQRPTFLHRRFFEEWIPMEQHYFEAFRIAEGCDCVFSFENGGWLQIRDVNRNGKDPSGGEL